MWKIPYSGPHDGAFSSVSINHSPQFDLLNHSFDFNICPSYLTPDFVDYKFTKTFLLQRLLRVYSHPNRIYKCNYMAIYMNTVSATKLYVVGFWLPNGWKISNLQDEKHHNASWPRPSRSMICFWKDDRKHFVGSTATLQAIKIFSHLNKNKGLGKLWCFFFFFFLTLQLW